MKISPSANYWVNVRPDTWDVEAPHTEFYATIHDVPRPWDFATLPPTFDRVDTVQQARLSRLLKATYIVASDETRAGAVEKFQC